MTTVYFIRHAKADNHNKNDRERPLTKRGKKETEIVTEFLEDKNIEIAVSSPYKRAIDTIYPFTSSHDLKIETYEGFREAFSGEKLLGDIDKAQSKEELLKAIEKLEIFSEKQWEDFEYKSEDGDALGEIQKNNIEALNIVLEKYEGKNIIIGSHGVALSVILNYFDKSFGFEEFMKIRFINPWIVKMEFDKKELKTIEKNNLYEPEYVDMHIHSRLSDGTATIEQILEEVIENEVKVFSITEHNLLSGTKKMMEMNIPAVHKFIPGVEIDTNVDNVNYHVLAYDFDINNKRLNEIVEYCRHTLDEVSVKLIKIMEKEHPNICLSEFREYAKKPTIGGWHALHYFKEKGLITDLNEGFKIYNDYGISHTSVAFPEIKEVSKAIREAGGKSILAHPGKVILINDIKAFSDKVIELVDMGLDGIECFYPGHSEEVTNACLEICKAKNLFITTGADFHGTFQKNQINQLKITKDMLSLWF